MNRFTYAAIALAFLLSGTPSVNADQAHVLFSYTDFRSITELELTTSAGTTTHRSVDRGWYNEDGAHLPVNDNYLVGFNGSSDGGGDDLNYRNWFLFRIPQLTTDVYTAATLKLEVPTPTGYISPLPFLTYELFDITTDRDALVAGTGDVAAFDDLGSGIQFGSTLVFHADEGTTLSIPLNAAALASLNTPMSSLWGIGGAMVAVPEPNSALLAMLAAGGIAVMVRLRRRVR
jgi:hypothetical protein